MSAVINDGCIDRRESASRRWRVLVVAAAVFVVSSASNLQTPLYGAYAALGAHSPGATAVAFACYMVGLLPVFVLLGGIFDRVGRRLPLVVAAGLAGLATLTVTLMPGLVGLGIARFLHGVALGLGIAAGTAFLADTLPGENAARDAAAWVTAATSLGFGLSPLLTTLTIQPSAVAPPFSYYAHIVTAIAVTILLLTMSYIVRRQPVPLMRLPLVPPRAGIFNGALLVAWSVSGLVLAFVSPLLARNGLTGWIWMPILLLNASGLVFQPIARRMTPEGAVRTGLLILPLGYGLIGWGALTGDLGTLLIGAGIVGSVAYGFVYMGGLAAMSVLGGHDRPRAVSGFLLSGSLGLCLPVVLAGALADRFGEATSIALFGVCVAVASWSLAMRAAPVIPIPARGPMPA